MLETLGLKFIMMSGHVDRRTSASHFLILIYATGNSQRNIPYLHKYPTGM